MTILSILLIDLIISHKVVLILLCVYMNRKSLIRKYSSFYCVLTSQGSPRITHLFFVGINFLFYQHHRQDQIDDGYYWIILKSFISNTTWQGRGGRKTPKMHGHFILSVVSIGETKGARGAITLPTSPKNSYIIHFCFYNTLNKAFCLWQIFSIWNLPPSINKKTSLLLIKKTLSYVHQSVQVHSTLMKWKFNGPHLELRVLFFWLVFTLWTVNDLHI